MSTKINKIKYFIVVVVFLLPLSSLAAEVNISPQNLAVVKDSEIAIKINVNNVANLFGTAFDLVFDPDILSFVSAQKGSFLEKDGASTVLLATVNPVNTLIIAYSRLAVSGAPTGVSGSDTLLNLTFKTKEQGVSNLVFQNNALCDTGSVSNCNKITTNWQNSSIIVNSSDSAAPSTPENIIATSSLTVEINWDAASDNIGVVGYKIYKNGVLIATTANNFYIDSDIVALTTYNYGIAAYDAANNESSAAAITVATPPPIDNKPPSRFNGFPSGALSYNTKQIQLSLSTDEDANCKYSTFANAAYAAMNNVFSITGFKNHSQIISNLTNSTFYRYYIKCEDKAENINNDDYIIEFSIDNPPIMITPDTSAPVMSGNIKATTSLNVSLSWNATNSARPVTGYKIFREGIQVATTSNTFYSDSKLSPSKKYDYTVSAYDENNNISKPSAPVKTGLITKIYNGITMNTSNSWKSNLQGPFAIGMRSDQVKVLQKMLAQYPEIYPEGRITGYYGSLTAAAVQRFQKKYGIVNSGSPDTTGYGLAGPETRAKLNEIYIQNLNLAGIDKENSGFILSIAFFSVAYIIKKVIFV